MATKNFSELEAAMSPDAIARSDAKAKVIACSAEIG